MTKKPAAQERRKLRGVPPDQYAAAARASRLRLRFNQLTAHHDQLQRNYDALVEMVKQRAQANDTLQAALIAQRDGRMRMFETYEGIVDHALDDSVVVVYQIGDDLVEQTYLRDQFLEQRLPEKGAPLAVYVLVAELPREPAEASDEWTAEEAAVLSKRRKNVVTLPKEF